MTERKLNRDLGEAGFHLRLAFPHCRRQLCEVASLLFLTYEHLAR